MGDFEVFGKIESFMKRSDAQSRIEVPELEQCFSLANAVCENVLAANLIRARLRQSGSDYHYQNPAALQQTQTFIEQSLLSFLKGMYGDRMTSDSERSFLHKLLGLNEAAYKRWLSRATVEMLYWTAKQPDPAHPDQLPFGECSPLYSHKNGYALHLNRTGRLDPDLYPVAGAKEGHDPAPDTYPDCFQNSAGRLNLGHNNAVFPLTTLMRGLTRLCTGILTHDHSGTALSPEPSQK